MRAALPRLALFACFTLASASSYAQPLSDGFRLEYRAPSNDACPTEAAFRQRLASRLGEDPVRASADRVVRVEITREGALRRASLSLLARSGASLGGRSFAPARTSCRELVDAVALSLTLTLQELARQPETPATPVAPTPAPTPAPMPSEEPTVILVPRVDPSARAITSIEPTPPDPPPPPPTPRGLEFGVRMGYGSFTVTDQNAWSRLEDPGGGGVYYRTSEWFEGSFGFDASVGWRFAPHFSVGARGGYQLLRSREDRGDLSAWTLGVYGRWYMFPGLATGDIDPWFGLGVDALARFTLAGVASTSSSTEAVTLSTHAVALPMSLGVDVHVTDRVALGVSGTLSWWISYEQCLDGRVSTVATSPCSKRGDFPTGIATDAPVHRLLDNTLWSVSLDLRYTLPL